MAKITESKIEKKVVAYCRHKGLYCRKFCSPSNRGVPDRVIIGNGKVLFLELKRPGNKPTALQEHEMKQIESHGVFAVWADSYEKAVMWIDAQFFGGIETEDGKQLQTQDARSLI